VTYGTPMKEARIADYPARAKVGDVWRDLRCIRGPLQAAKALMELAVKNGGTLRHEIIKHDLGEAYYEVILP